MSFNATIDQFLNNFIVSTGAIAFYNCIEIYGLIIVTFRRYDTLYFWSLLGATTGVMLFNGGFLDLFYHMYQTTGTTIYEPLIVLTIGWYAMVTGFALILYSRLYLISVPKNVLQMCRIMIGYNVVFSHFPTTVLTFGANVIGTDPWTNGYSAMEKTQMTFFSIQEIILGSLYLYYTRRLTLNKKLTRLVKQTMLINVLVIALDISMLGTQFANLYTLQIMMKTMIYSTKIKLEFYILNTLTRHFDKPHESAAPGSALSNTIGSHHSPAVHGGTISPASEHDLGKFTHHG